MTNTTTHTTGDDALPGLGEVRVYPAAPAQERLWFAQEQNPEDRSYHVFLAFSLIGDVDISALRAAVSDVVRFHEPLRTTFRRIDGALHQIVAEPPESVPVPFAARTCVAVEGPEFSALLAQRAVEPFDLRRGPLFRADLYSTDGGTHVMLLCMHHIVTDGRSLGIVCEDIAAAYRRRLAGRALAPDEELPQFGDYCEMLSEQAGDPHAPDSGAEHWREMLSPMPTPLRLPLDRLRPAVQRPEAERLSFQLDAGTSAALRETAREEGVPLSCLALASYLLVLAAWTGDSDVIVGIPTAGRADEDVRDMVGLFVNTLPVRLSIPEELGVSHLLRAVASRLTEALDHEQTPLEKIVEAVAPGRHAGRNPLFDVLFAAQNTSDVTLDLPDVRTGLLDVDTSWTRHDVELNVWGNEPEMRFMLVMRRSLFERTTAESLASAIGRTVTALADDDASWEDIVRGARPDAPRPRRPGPAQSTALERIRGLPGVTGAALVQCAPDPGALRQTALVSHSTPLTEERVLRAAGSASGVDSVALLNALPADPAGRLDLGAVEATVLGRESEAQWHAEAGGTMRATLVDDPASAGERPRTPQRSEPAGGGARQVPAEAGPGDRRPPSLVHRGPAPELPHHDLAEALARAAETSKGITLVDDEGGTARLSYAQLHATAQEIATMLRGAASSPAPVLLAFRSNSWFLPRLWGCILAGLPAMPWVPPLDEHEIPGTLREVLAVLGEATILAEGAIDGPVAQEAASAGPGVLHIREEDYSAGREGPASEKGQEDSSAQGCAPLPSPGTDSDALLLRTSGSTRTPKAVRVTHGQILTRSAGAALACELSADEISLNWMPLDHVGGVVMFHMRDVILGFEQVQVATHHVLAEPARWMRLCAEHAVTTTWAPNFAFALAARAVKQLAAEGAELGALRHILNGGEAVRRSTVLEFLRAFVPLGLPETAVRPSWGMSETTSGETDSARCTLAELSSAEGPVPVGRLYPGFSVRIVDESGTLAPEGEEGRLEVSGPSVTPGYYRDPERTAEAFTEDGWFDTGDLATVRDGELTIIGRSKDTVIINGLNFSCEEIEAEVERRCAVRPSCTAAFSLPHDENAGERLGIATVPGSSPQVSPAELAAEIRDAARRVTGHPAEVFVLAEQTVPRTTIGKIMRTALSRQLLDGSLEAERHPLPGAGATGPADAADWLFVPRERPALDFDPDRNPVLAPRPPVESVAILPLGGQGAQEDLVLSLESLGVAASLTPSEGLSAARLITEPGPANSAAATADAVVLLLGRGSEGSPAPDAIELTQAVGRLAVQLSQSTTTAGSRRELVVVSHGEDDDQRSPAWIGLRGALAGLLRSLSDELPVGLRFIQANDVSAQALAQEIARGQESVHLRSASDGVSRTCAALEPLTSIPDDASLPPAGGSFVITGGTGGIGLSLAEYLLEEREATVLLLGRTRPHRPSPGQQDRLSALCTRYGSSRVHVTAADVTDRQALASAVEQFESLTGASVRGAFHCAGGFSESAVADSDDDTAKEAMEAKVTGALHLIEVLADHESPFLVLCSSVSGYLGAPMASFYAAANSFLDELALRSPEDSPVRCRSVAWSMWRETGLSRGFQHAERASQRGTLVLDPDAASACWPVVLGTSEPVVLVGLDDTRPLIRALLNPPGRGLRALELADGPEQLGIPTDVLGRRLRVLRTTTDRAAADAAPSSAAPAGLRGELERRVSSHWCEVLSLPEVDRTASFFDLGGTSIHLSQVHERLRQELDASLTLAQLFQLHTVAELSAYLARSLPASQSSAEPQPHPTVTGPVEANSTLKTSTAAARGRERAERRRRRRR